MVALDSFGTLSPNLSKFSGRGGGSVWWLCDILTNFSKFLSYWEGKESTSTWPFWKTFMNFPPPCLRGVAKHVSWVWWKIWQIRTDLVGRSRNVQESRYKIIIKEYHKVIVSFFLLLEGGYIILPYWCCGYLLFVIENVDFIVFTSEVTKSHHTWKSFFSSISRSQFWSINKYILCCTQHRKCNTHIIHKIRRGNGKFSSMY